ncbi:MAG: 6,7-dimethyl-8-ribityllumazine synthase [Verrucomicrobiae bacterium]|nr:6,7-dimethyl-8-ribityllumazine synthase [Verrucomicrobiae bacterium]
MLKKVVSRERKFIGGNFAIVASNYNKRFVDSMVNAAKRRLEKAGANSVNIFRVPGAYEIPVLVANLLVNSSKKYAAIICLGVVIRGETAHADLIGTAVTNALTRMQIEYLTPIIHEILLLNNIEQAEKRCLDPKHNRGLEAAETAIEMANVIKSISSE